MYERKVMPIYEYECKACGCQFEALQKINDDPITHCKTCGENKVEKLISAPSFQLKGSGWYATDFKNPPSSKTQPAADQSSKQDNSNDSKKETVSSDK